jgi:hypothetical protein
MLPLFFLRQVSAIKSVWPVSTEGKLYDLFVQIVTDVWHKYGPFAALAILLLVAYEWRVTRLWNARLADKDKEIDRIAKERDTLLDVILKRRQSSKGQ